MVAEPKDKIENSSDRIVTQTSPSNNIPDSEHNTGDGIATQNPTHQFEEFTEVCLRYFMLSFLINELFVFNELLSMDNLVSVQFFLCLF